MAADLNLLDPELKNIMTEVLERCRAAGVEMRPNNGLRDPFEQARLWRQSRSSEEIQVKIAEFEKQGAQFLAACLNDVGPQHGEHVTNAAPGFSWHQWGQALDCFWLLDGKAEWSSSKLINWKNGYQVYAAEAKALGLFPGGYWKNFKDWPHIQLQIHPSPNVNMSVTQIDQEMQLRYG